MKTSKTTQDFFDIPSIGNHTINTPLVHDQKDGTRALILSDVHIPYHNVEGLKEAVDTGLDAGVDVIILNGDFLDFSRVSSYNKNPDMPRFADEIAMGKAFIAMLREQFPDAKFYATGGNHQDERIENYLERNAPELVDLPELKLENLLKYDEFDIEDYSGSMLTFGDALIGHGDEIRGISGVTPARKALMKFPDASCVITGHLHRGESHFERTYTGKVRHAHVSGHLGEMSPDYMGQAANGWRIGFIIADVVEGETMVDHWVKQDNGQWINVSPVQTSINYNNQL